MEPVIFIIDRLAKVYTLLIFVRVILAWFRVSLNSPIPRFVIQTTQPIFDFVRKIFPRTALGMIDFAPIIAFILVDLIRYFLLIIIITYF